VWSPVHTSAVTAPCCHRSQIECSASGKPTAAQKIRRPLAFENMGGMKKLVRAFLAFLVAFIMLLGYAIMDAAVHHTWIFDDSQAVLGVILMSVGITAVWLFYSRSKDLG
jgi:hypothetical protein